jgi:2-oxoglutarate ferredoxin oxidoreductase subunit alpha
MAQLTIQGFALAEKYRMPCMLLADGTMGQMMEPVELPDTAPEMTEKPWALTGTGLSRKHNIINSLSLTPDELERWNIDRYARYAKVEADEVMYEEYLTEDADVCVVGYGIAARVARNAVNAARAKGIKAGMFRPITLWPFPKAALNKLATTCRAFISVELSMGQLIEDVELAIRCSRPVTLCNRTGGMIPSPEQVLASIEEAAAKLN